MPAHNPFRGELFEPVFWRDEVVPGHRAQYHHPLGEVDLRAGGICRPGIGHGQRPLGSGRRGRQWCRYWPGGGLHGRQRRAAVRRAPRCALPTLAAAGRSRYLGADRGDLPALPAAGTVVAGPGGGAVGAGNVLPALYSPAGRGDGADGGYCPPVGGAGLCLFVVSGVGQCPGNPGGGGGVQPVVWLAPLPGPSGAAPQIAAGAPG